MFFLDPPDEGSVKGKLEHSIIRFLSFATKAATDYHKYNRQLCIELSLTPKVFLTSDYEAYAENLGIKN